LLEADDFDFEVAAAWVAGSDAAASIAGSSADAARLLRVVREILKSETDPDGQLHLVGECGVEPGLALRLLRSFTDGLYGGRDAGFSG
jgi:hypothetical protein